MTLSRQPVAAARQLKLTLYLAGGSAASISAAANLNAILDELGITVRATITDVFASPDEAMQQRIFVTPALVVDSAHGREMLIGDLRLRAPVLDLLRSLMAKEPTTDSAARPARRR